ncbi:MAG TPA: ABC transporter ATP-binding protein [Flexistipes sinusarabici]|uniref:ABC transporter ATP-binding protein n=1 Tax=Flexistipes sinusarabici TaxID=2352 RepID=A0A3D5Q941_FLESI|nr:ABC transporter ATP-binding protein [Flexistipes sinusarabici]
MIHVHNLFVELKHSQPRTYILRDISLELKKGEILGIAGESGSGKTVLSKTLMGLIKEPLIKTDGTISIKGEKYSSLSHLKKYRGRFFSMIFQNPSASLNPVFTVGYQLIETLMTFNKEMNKKEAEKEAVKLLSEVEIDHPEERMKSYPHNLSGGMNQRVMIALALSTNPEILIADEPTTALDVTIQAQIIDLLLKLNKQKSISIIFISHDLSLLQTICDNILILYAGELMEKISASDLKSDMIRHPYTYALKSCIPDINKKEDFLFSIPGTIKSNTAEDDNRCVFHDRCNYMTNICETKKPKINESINYKCHHPLLQK